MNDYYLVVYPDYTSHTYVIKQDKKAQQKGAQCYICSSETTIAQLNTFIYIDLVTKNNIERGRFNRVW